MQVDPHRIKNMEMDVGEIGKWSFVEEASKQDGCIHTWTVP